MRFPTVRGDTVVFSYAGDLWVSKLEGGTARRLTSHPGMEVRPKLSADGSTVAFTGSYDGSPNVYVVPIEGGEPKRLTFDAEPNNVLGWTPDGRIAYATTAGNFVPFQQRLMTISPQGGLPRATPIKEVTELSYFGDGGMVAYTRAISYNFNWRRYRGGTQGRISLYEFAGNKYSELPSRREQSYFPMAVGRSVFYISDKNGATLNLYRYDLDRKSEAQLTRFTDADVRWPSTDGKTIVYERNGFLWRYDISSAQIAKIAPKIPTEALSSRPVIRNFGNQITNASLSPSGNRVAVEARGEIFSLPAKNGDTRNLTENIGIRCRFPEWSPDGQRIAFMSDHTGEQEIYTIGQRGGEATQLTTGAPIKQIVNVEWSPDGKLLGVRSRSNEYWIVDPATKKATLAIKAERGLGSTDWSPDSKWIAFSQGVANGLAAIYFYEVATQKVTQVTTGFYADSAVAFDQSGKYLYFVSTRTFQPTFGQYEFSLKVEDGDRIYVMPLTADATNPLLPGQDEEPERPSGPPSGGPPPGGPPAGGPPAGGPPASGPPPAAARGLKLDFEGMADRALPLPLPPGAYGIFGGTNGVFFFSGGTLSLFDFNSRQATPILQGIMGGLSVNANRTKAVVMGPQGLSIVDLRPGANLAAGRVETTGVSYRWNPREEWRQIFWEAWRFERDNFYDPNMNGVDWPAMGKKYAEFLPWVNHRSDLSYVLGMMLGELGTGHAYVQGGELGLPPQTNTVARLGVDYAAVGNAIQLAKIYRGFNYAEGLRSPLGEPGLNVKDGEYLLEIDGKKVDASMNPDELLIGRLGTTVTLTINGTPSLTGARKVRVRPISSEGPLRARSFTEANRKKVAELSGGRIGYMHVSNTATEGAIDFIRGFYSQTEKDAMIVDERWNGGGFIQPWFVDTLARRKRAGIQIRHSADDADSVAIEGPKVMLINQYAGSGGDFFPWMFRQSKLGPLIGKRTWGGLVGISGGAPLIDGGSVTAPEFAIYDFNSGEIIAENTGVDPDMDIDMRPDLVAVGRDPQLEAAVEHLMKALKEYTPRKKRDRIPPVGAPGRIKP